MLAPMELVDGLSRPLAAGERPGRPSWPGSRADQGQQQAAVVTASQVTEQGHAVLAQAVQVQGVATGFAGDQGQGNEARPWRRQLVHRAVEESRQPHPIVVVAATVTAPRWLVPPTHR